METVEMAENPGTVAEAIKNICNIVQERDKTIRETDIKIEYYKNSLEKILDNIKSLEKKEKGIEEKNKFIHEQIGQLECIKNSMKAGQEVARQSLINHQYFQQIATRELKTKENEMDCVEQKCIRLYTEAKEKLKQNPLYQELEKHKVQFLKADNERRDLEVKIRNRRQINTQKKEIQKKIFYNFFVKMAKNYVYQERVKELKKLKLEELEAVKRLFAAQEKVKLKQKLGAPTDKIKKMAHITFGSQESRTDNNLHNKVVITPQQKKARYFNEKLNTMFTQDETKNVLPSPKINVLNQQVIVPAFMTPTFTPPEKRKYKTINLSRKLQKLMKSPRDGTDVRSSSQRSENQLSQFSQQSQPSQPEHLNTETPATKNQEYSIKNGDIRKPIIQQQERQEILIEMKENVPTQYQMVESLKVGAEQFKMEYPPVTPSGLQGNPIIRGDIKQGRTPSTPDMPHTEPILSTPKGEIVPKTAVFEPSKSVRFNLEPTHQTETKSMFKGQSMFGNIFNTFSNRATNQNEVMISQQATGATNTTLNLSYTEPAGENSQDGLNFDHGESSQIRSFDDCSYELEGDGQQTFKPPEMTPLGGAFFSFGKNLFRPF